MDNKEVFSQLLRYFPKGEEGLLRKNLCLFAQACLAAGEFAQAQTYADMLLAQEPDEEQKATAYRIRLYVKLQCRNDKEFVHCPVFSKELPEYLELLSACSSDEQKLKRLLGLANENLRTVVQDRVDEEKRKREEEQRRQKEEQRKEALRIQRSKERKDRITVVGLGVALTFITLELIFSLVMAIISLAADDSEFPIALIAGPIVALIAAGIVLLLRKQSMSDYADPSIEDDKICMWACGVMFIAGVMVAVLLVLFAVLF